MFRLSVRVKCSKTGADAKEIKSWKHRTEERLRSFLDSITDLTYGWDFDELTFRWDLEAEAFTRELPAKKVERVLGLVEDAELVSISVVEKGARGVRFDPRLEETLLTFGERTLKYVTTASRRLVG